MHLSVEGIARVCHEANAELCRVNADWTQNDWDDAEQWQRDSVLDGVVRHLEHPETTPEQSHANWCAKKRADGWVYGSEKDPLEKTHPCLVDYVSLPPEQRAKDHLFKAIVQALVPFVGAQTRDA